MPILRSIAYDTSLVGGQAGTINLDDFKINEKPNLFQIRNYGTATLYVSVEPGVSGSKYDVAIQAGSTRKLTVPYSKISILYLYTTVSANVRVVANYVDAFAPADLDYNEATVVLNYDALPSVAISDGTHTANVNSDGSLDVNIKNVPVNVDVVVAPTIEITNDEGNPIPTTLPTTTEAKLDHLDTIKTSVGLLDNAIDGNEMQVDIVTLPALPAGSNFIGRSGAVAFKGSANFTRPADTNIYAVDDAITNSTSAPAILNMDLASFGAVVGQFAQITNARVVVSTKGSVKSLQANIWIYNVTFAGTNDNSALAIDDTTANLGGVTIPCLNTFSNASNHKCVSDPGSWIIQLAAADTKLYLALQSANDFTPGSEDVITVVLEGVLL